MEPPGRPSGPFCLKRYHVLVPRLAMAVSIIAERFLLVCSSTSRAGRKNGKRMYSFYT